MLRSRFRSRAVASRSRRPKYCRPVSCRPLLEALEDRVVPADLILNGTSQTFTNETVAYDDVVLTNGAAINIVGSVTLQATNVTVDSNSRITADGTGFGAAQGPGAGSSLPLGSSDNAAGSGAGHGGRGGDSRNAETHDITTSIVAGGSIYGDPLNPTQMGSGGGNTGATGNFGTEVLRLGGSGGGAIRLQVTNTLDVDGTLTANGNAGDTFGAFAGGGGSGGSIFVETGTLTGSGIIRANGGRGRITSNQSGVEISGGGAGGRIAIYSTTLLDFTGTTQAKGGVQSDARVVPSQQGEDGTIAHNGTVAGLCDAGTPFSSCVVTDRHFLVNNLTYTFTNRTLEIQSGGQLFVKAASVDRPAYAGSISADNFVVRSSATPGVFVDRFAELSLTGGNATIEGTIQASRFETELVSMTLTSSGTISADRLGYEFDRGPGRGAALPPGSSNNAAGSGAGHGGLGGSTSNGIAGGAIYGDALDPTDPGSDPANRLDLGSGGGQPGTNARVGGSGGGAIDIHVSGLLQLDGTIRADGEEGGLFSAFAGGGGSGGSIAVRAGTLSGVGLIRANGGTARTGNNQGTLYVAGAGAGGRIAVEYTNLPFTGSTQARGGIQAGVNPVHQGEDGTIAYNGTVAGLCDTGTPATTCVVTGPHFLVNNFTYTFNNLETQSGGQWYVKSNYTDTIDVQNLVVRPSTTAGLFVDRFGSLMLRGGSATVEGPIQASRFETELVSLTLTSTGSIRADGLGHPGNSGPGAGQTVSPAGAGGGYGGRGGTTNTAAVGGTTYGIAQNPTDFGSGGGGGGGGVPGGAGGGAIKLAVSDILQIDGRLSTDGDTGAFDSRRTFAAGGGSGGSILIHAGTIAGAGIISAAGGAGRVYNVGDPFFGGAGGGGGGGRVCIYFGSDSHLRLASVAGGTGFRSGEPGTSCRIQVDTTPPETTITSMPPSLSTGNVTFEFQSNELGSSFECRLDTADFAPCDSPKSYSLPSGTYTFEVQAIDAAGNVDETPASYTWTVDADPPDAPLIESGPDNPTNSTEATFTFSAEAGATFECSLDNAVFSACNSGQTYSELTEGEHTFQVRAIDAAGNEGPPSSIYIWIVDRTPPDTMIAGGPIEGSQTTDTSVTFSFESSEAGTFTCALDGGAPTNCNDGSVTYSNLDEGPHSFTVTAVDAAGNVDETPATRNWTVDTTPPNQPSAPALDPSSDTGAQGDNRTADSTPTIFGMADPGTTVTIFADGSPVAIVTTNQNGDWTYTFADEQELSEGDHLIQVRAQDAAGNLSGLSEPLSITVDTIPPDTTIGDHPSNPTTETTATFTFDSTESEQTFKCSLDGSEFEPCASGKNYSGLSLGAHTFKVFAVDAAGNEDPAPATFEWTIQPATTPDYCRNDEIVLEVPGSTAGNDHIVIKDGPSPGQYTVTINGRSVTYASPDGPYDRIIVHGGAGNDDIQITGSLDIPVWLFGDDGNDRLKGAGGHDVLFGGDGDDLLVGGNGRDLMVGGEGADRLLGNADDDILVSGTTDYDDEAARDGAFCAVMEEWTSDRSFAVRRDNLFDGSGSTDRENGAHLLNAMTVHDDGDHDVLTGAAGQDWFLANLLDESKDEDKITDATGADFSQDWDFINSP